MKVQLVLGVISIATLFGQVSMAAECTTAQLNKLNSRYTRLSVKAPTQTYKGVQFEVTNLCIDGDSLIPKSGRIVRSPGSEYGEEDRVVDWALPLNGTVSSCESVDENNCEWTQVPTNVSTTVTLQVGEELENSFDVLCTQTYQIPNCK